MFVYFSGSITTCTPGNNVSSPVKQQQQQQSRMPAQLPTSPTHMAAMRGATQQRGFDYDQQQQLQQQQFMQQQQQQHQGGNQQQFIYPSPSPDSPGQWSSGSPLSSDQMSEGVRSPPGMQQQHQQQQFQQISQQQQQMMQQQTDGVLI